MPARSAGGAPSGARRRRRFVPRLLLASAVVVVVLASPIARAGTALIVEQDAGPPDAIIMLASHEWERLPAAAALARRYPGAIVLLTVPRTVTPYNCDRCSERVQSLEAEGIARARVQLLRDTDNTHGEAKVALRRARHEPFSRLLIVTSPYHTRRALATFERVFEGTGIAIGVTAADPARGQPRRWWLDPYDRYYVRYEWAAIVKYRVQYGVAIF